MARTASVWIVLLLSACGNSPPTVPDADSTTARTFSRDRYRRIAIITQVSAGGRLAWAARIVEDEFIRTALEKGYVVPTRSRSDIEKLVREIEFQDSPLSENKAAEFGRIMNVPAVVVVDLRRLRNGNDGLRATISARMIDAESAEVVWRADSGPGAVKGKWENESRKLARVARQTAGRLPGQGGSRGWGKDLIQAAEAPGLARRGLKRIVVLSRTNDPNGVQAQHASVLEGCFSKVLRGRGYDVPTRLDIEAIQREIGFQLDSGLVDRAAAKFGRLHNVRAVLVVRLLRLRVDAVHKRGNNYTTRLAGYQSDCLLAARLLDIERAEVLWQGSYLLSRQFSPTGKSGIGRGDPPVPDQLLAEGCKALARELPRGGAARKTPQPGNIAVLVRAGRVNVNSPHVPAPHLRFADAEFSRELLARGYRVAPRGDVAAALEELAFQQDSGMTRAGGAKLGRMLGVPQVLLVTVYGHSYKSRSRVEARILDLSSGRIVWNDMEFRGRHSPFEAMSESARLLAARLPPTRKVDLEDELFVARAPALDPNDFRRIVVLSRSWNRGGRRRQETVEDATATSRFVAMLMGRGVRVIERGAVEELLREGEFQRSGITEQNAVAFGKMLNVRGVLLVGVPQSDSATPRRTVLGPRGYAATTVTARLLDVERAEVVWQGTASGKARIRDAGETIQVIQDAATRLAAAFPGRE